MLKLRKPRVCRKPPQQPSVATEVQVPEESAPQVPDANVQVIYGASVQVLPLAGQTISAARPLLEMVLRANPRSPILINGAEVPANHVITSGDVVEVVHQAGEKGVARGLAN